MYIVTYTIVIVFHPKKLLLRYIYNIPFYSRLHMFSQLRCRGISLKYVSFFNGGCGDGTGLGDLKPQRLNLMT